MEIINHSYSQQEAAIAPNAASCKVLVDGQPMRQRISLFLIVALLTSAVGAQVKVRDKGDAALRRAEAAQRKAQAIDILKGVVESAADIQELRTRVAVLTGALDLLWKHDEDYARANLTKAVAALSERFAADSTQKQERSEIRAAIAVLLTALARHDPKAAARLQDKFQKLLEDVLKGYTLSLNERLSLAQGSLDFDPAQSAALAAKVLETGIPGSLPTYLNELEQRDPATAASLFRVALPILAGGRVYNPVHVTMLSTYVFRERQMSVPMIRGGDEGVPMEFGMFGSPLSPPSKELNRELVAAYLAASGAYLNNEAIGLEQSRDPDPIHVALTWFLVKKLGGYAERLGLDGQNWLALDAKYTIVAERMKISDQVLSGLASVAHRIVAENSVFWFDSGEAAFAAAEKSRDPAERAELMANGIRQQIDDGKFTEAVQKIAELKDEKISEQLNVYLSCRTAEVSLKKLDWYSFNVQVNRVSDSRLRTYLLLLAALAARNAGNKKLSSEFLLTAMASFPKIEDRDSRAAAFVTTAGILIDTADASLSAQVLTEGVNAINHTDGYDGGVYGVMLEVSKTKVWLPLAKFDLSHCFELAAKRDWSTALAAAQSIESKPLRSQAYIAACRQVL